MKRTIAPLLVLATLGCGGMPGLSQMLGVSADVRMGPNAVHAADLRLGPPPASVGATLQMSMDAEVKGVRTRTVAYDAGGDHVQAIVQHYRPVLEATGAAVVVRDATMTAQSKDVVLSVTCEARSGRTTLTLVEMTGLPTDGAAKAP